MSTRKSIIPEFMKNNPDDTFEFLFPLKIALDEATIKNSIYTIKFEFGHNTKIFKYKHE